MQSDDAAEPGAHPTRPAAGRRRLGDRVPPHRGAVAAPDRLAGVLAVESGRIAASEREAPNMFVTLV